MSPRLLSRMTGMPGCFSWMWAISASSWSSARRAAKWAICGLKEQTRSAVASTMALQNSKMASSRLFQMGRELGRIGIEADAEQGVVLLPGGSELLVKVATDPSGDNGEFVRQQAGLQAALGEDEAAVADEAELLPVDFLVEHHRAFDQVAALHAAVVENRARMEPSKAWQSCRKKGSGRRVRPFT